MNLYDYGVDWLTMTWDTKNDRLNTAFNVIRNFQELNATEGDDIEEKSWMGYEGTQQGALFVGARGDGMLMRVSGAAAREVAKLLKESECAGKPTRIDFQTTAKTEEENADALRAVRRKVQANISRKKGNQARNLATYSSRGRDCGISIGSRCSSTFLRIYDKSLEQNYRVEKGLIRYEVEFKGKRAQEAWKHYQAAKDGEALSKTLTGQEMAKMGVDMKWLQADAQIKFVSEYQGTSVQKKLAWLERFVSPTVAVLVRKVGRERVLQALGL